MVAQSYNKDVSLTDAGVASAELAMAYSMSSL